MNTSNFHFNIKFIFLIVIEYMFYRINQLLSSRLTWYATPSETDVINRDISNDRETSVRFDDHLKFAKTILN